MIKLYEKIYLRNFIVSILNKRSKHLLQRKASQQEGIKNIFGIVKLLERLV